MGPKHRNKQCHLTRRCHHKDTHIHTHTHIHTNRRKYNTHTRCCSRVLDIHSNGDTEQTPITDDDGRWRTDKGSFKSYTFSCVVGWCVCVCVKERRMIPTIKQTCESSTRKFKSNQSFTNCFGAFLCGFYPSKHLLIFFLFLSLSQHQTTSMVKVRKVSNKS